MHSKATSHISQSKSVRRQTISQMPSKNAREFTFPGIRKDLVKSVQASFANLRFAAKTPINANPA